MKYTNEDFEKTLMALLDTLAKNGIETVEVLEIKVMPKQGTEEIALNLFVEDDEDAVIQDPPDWVKN